MGTEGGRGRCHCHNPLFGAQNLKGVFMGERLWLLAPGNKGTSDAYRTGYERIWGKDTVDIPHKGKGVLVIGHGPDSRKLEHFRMNPDHDFKSGG